jgi:flagellar biosynthesis/type III secretory pathway M-ring protein FliF/YscJ
MVDGGTGPRQVSPTAKVVLAAAFAMWIIVLVVLRARHQRVVKRALAKMEREAEQAAEEAGQQETGASHRRRIAETPSGVRVGDAGDGVNASERSTDEGNETRAAGERAEPSRSKVR